MKLVILGYNALRFNDRFLDAPHSTKKSGRYSLRLGEGNTIIACNGNSSAALGGFILDHLGPMNLLATRCTVFYLCGPHGSWRFRIPDSWHLTVHGWDLRHKSCTRQKSYLRGQISGFENPGVGYLFVRVLHYTIYIYTCIILVYIYVIRMYYSYISMSL